ncbi:hypothetical protein FOL46_003221 [Perkinsus olseni]|uniref:Angio-associated migratory cell protein n=1 Tax=Perkinsus olseni TaxID=32597 RepID=A0A7J6M455_PEROL|nr:hypothetical protein FOL46_003221 [Perkinsus olseni]
MSIPPSTPDKDASDARQGDEEQQEQEDIYINPDDCIDLGEGVDDSAEVAADERAGVAADLLEAADEEEERDNCSITYPFTDAALCLAANPKDHTIVAVGLQNDTAELLRIRPGSVEPLRILRGHTDSVVSVAFSSDGELLATGSYDGTVKVWEVAKLMAETGDCSTPMLSLEGPGEGVEWVSWHPKGHAVCAGSQDGTAWMWWAGKSSGGGNVMQVFAGAHGAAVNCGSFSIDGKAVVTAGLDGVVAVWNPRTGAIAASCRTNEEELQRSQRQRQQDGDVDMEEEVPEGGIVSMALMPPEAGSSPVAVVGTIDGDVKLVQLETGKLLGQLRGTSDVRIAGQSAATDEGASPEDAYSVEALAFSKAMSPGTAAAQPSPILLAAGDLKGKLLIYEASKLLARGSGPRHQVTLTSGATRLAWHPLGLPVVAVGQTDGVVEVVNGLTGEILSKCLGHQEQILDVLCVPGFEEGWFRVISAGDDNCIKIFDLQVMA